MAASEEQLKLKEVSLNGSENENNCEIDVNKVINKQDVIIVQSSSNSGQQDLMVDILPRETPPESQPLIYKPVTSVIRVLPTVPQEPMKSNEPVSITYAEALKLTHFGKFNCLLIFLAGTIFTSGYFESVSLGFILPIAQCELHLSNQDKGLLSAINFAGMIITSHLSGFLADTLGRRRIMRPTLIAGFIVTVFSSFSQRFWILVLLRFLNGVFMSGSAAVIYAYLGEFHTDKTRTRAVMGSAVILGLGSMLLPALAYVVINQDWTLPLSLLGIDYKPWRLFMIVCGIPGFICGLLLCILPESPKFLLSQNREEEAIEALKKMHRWNGGGNEELKLSHIMLDDDITSEDMAKDESATNIVTRFFHAMWRQTALLFNRKHLRTTLIVCNGQFWLFLVVFGFFLWFPHITNIVVEFENKHPGESKLICDIIYEKHEALFNSNETITCITKLENKTYYYGMLLEIFYVVIFVCIGLTVNYVGKIPILFASIIICTSCGLSVIFIADLSIAVYMFVAYFLVGTVISLLAATTVELYPTHLRGMAICVSMMIGRTGAIFGSNIAGALIENYCEFTFYISTGALFCSAFLILCLPRKQPEDVIKANIES